MEIACVWVAEIVKSFAVEGLGLGGVFVVRALERRGNTSVDWPTRLAAGYALALGWLQCGATLAAFAGALTRSVAWILIASWVLMCAVAARRERLPWPRRSRWWLWFVPPMAVILLLATVPPWDRDEMVYHLALPRFFAMHHGYAIPDDNIFASLPLGWESLLSGLHALRANPFDTPVLNPRLVGAWTGLNVALATVGLARSLGARRLAPWAGFAWLTIPTAIELCASAYVEPYLVLFSTLALLGFVRAFRGDRALAGPAVVASAMCATIKYPGLLVCLVVVAGIVALQRRDRRPLALLVIAVLVASPFYVRNLVQRGNPIFPLAFELFGGRGWDATRAEAYSETLARYGYGNELADLFLLPVRLFTSYDFKAGFEGSIGPMCGLSALLGLVVAFRILHRVLSPEDEPRSSRTGVARALACAFGLLWFCFWAATVQQARFFLVAAPPLLAAGAVSAPLLLPRSCVRRLGVALAFVACAAWSAPGVRHLWNRQLTTAYLAGTQGDEQILARLLPTSYVAMRELEATVPKDGKVWLVWMHAYTYYLRRDYRVDCVYEGWRLEQLLHAAPTPEAAAAALAREGFTHLLVNHTFFLDGQADDVLPRTRELRAKWAALLVSGDLRVARSWGSVSLYEVRAR